MTAYLVLDGHVHYHAGYQIDRFLDHAAANLFALAGAQGLARDACQGALMLAEIGSQPPLARLRADLTRESRAWRIRDTDTDWIRISDSLTRDVWVFSGRQIVTAERLEVLALCTNESIPSGMTLAATVRCVQQAGAVAVIPWGLGKWIGARGSALRSFLASDVMATAPPSRLLLGDSYGRPAALTSSTIFRQAAAKGFWTLAGTDPLAISAHETLVGRCATLLCGSLQPERPSSTLRNILESLDEQPVTLGQHTRWFNCLHDQWHLRRHRLAKPRSPSGAEAR